ncbi:Cell division protein FtsZ [hydrothermal vent metagenome]|uniref:Cell division protein FtsZ n=1 Tax=hydrothermal vent metagenome TaxID=652676 RepID=A0A3B0QZJ0_9ZZZZ
MSSEFNNISFDLPKNQSNVIKVIGVGGGGSNAVNHMFERGIKGVDFVVCNTDAQALQNSPVPAKIQLGATLTEGLGAGANPTIGEKSAMESMDDIKNMLNTRAKMLFITVGMGGGTGTGAAPVIAKIAKELDILTVGIVTIPFSFEGKMRNEQAQIGIEKLRKNVDSLVVINNNKLREVYGNLGFKAGFSKADEVLSTAATGIAEVITHHYTQNIDLRDAKTVLANSGTAIMGSATSSGSNRAQNAITKALDSPLLNDNKIEGSKNVLLLIVSGTSEVTIDEIGEINDYIQSEAKTNVDIIMGVGEDESLGDAIAVTIVATGFNAEQQNAITTVESKKIIHKLEEEKKVKPQESIKTVAPEISEPVSEVTKHILHEDDFMEEGETPDHTTEINKLHVDYEKVEPIIEEEFEITTITKKEEPTSEELEEEENQISFTFDLPIQNFEEKKAAKTNIVESIDINEIEIVGLEEIKPEYVVGKKMVRHELEDEFTAEIDKLKSLSDDEKKIDENLNFELKIKKKDSIVNNVSEALRDEDVSPLNLTISELKDRADDRRNKMKEFNYKFVNRMNQNIDEIENIPAYKRMGVDLNEANLSSDIDSNKSRMTLGVDENDEIQLRSNNSFLHDNVD